MESRLCQKIHNLGSIEATYNFNNKKLIKITENSIEDYVGKITTLFLPFIIPSISDGKFYSLQNELSKILLELKRRHL